MFHTLHLVIQFLLFFNRCFHNRSRCGRCQRKIIIRFDNLFFVPFNVWLDDIPDLKQGWKLKSINLRYFPIVPLKYAFLWYKFQLQQGNMSLIDLIDNEAATKGHEAATKGEGHFKMKWQRSLKDKGRQSSKGHFYILQRALLLSKWQLKTKYKTEIRKFSLCII